jgi:hypothetical protein
MKCGLELQQSVLLILKAVSTLGGWTAVHVGPDLVFLSSMFPAHLTFNFNGPQVSHLPVN